MGTTQEEVNTNLVGQPQCNEIALGLKKLIPIAKGVGRENINTTQEVNKKNVNNIYGNNYYYVVNTENGKRHVLNIEKGYTLIQ